MNAWLRWDTYRRASLPMPLRYGEREAAPIGRRSHKRKGSGQLTGHGASGSR
jgi:hypothetical protein